MKQYDILEILDRVIMTDPNFKENRDNALLDLDGDKIKFNSLRLQVFKEHGTKCEYCGIEGKYFIKERLTEQNVRPHLNLYGVDSKGNNVLLTKYKINKTLPEYNISNYNVSCEICNKHLQSGDICIKTYIKKD